MSENIPESIPTSMDPRSKRPAKKRALSPASLQSAQVAQLMKNPERAINVNRARERKMAPPPEIVANVQGSSAGAGSGEFHVYKASRRREYERLKVMDEELKREKDNEEFEKKNEELRKRDEERTAKNRAKRNRKKQGAAAKAKATVEEEEKKDGSKVSDDASGKGGKDDSAKKGSFKLPNKQQSSTNNKGGQVTEEVPVVSIPDGAGAVIIDDD